MATKLKFYQTLTFTILFIGYGIYSYNRKSVTYTVPKLVEEGISKENAGTIASSQNLAYMIGKIICGVLSDKISPNLLFSGGLFLSGFFTLLFSQTNNFYLFVLFWFMNGLTQGAGWPSLAKFIQRWFAKEYLGIFWSILAASSNLSLSISPYLVTYVIFNYGWRFSLVISGTICIGFSALATLTLINYPENVGLVSFVQAKAPTKKVDDKINKSNAKNISTKDLFRNPFIWLISLSYMIVFLTKSCISDWGVFYLKDELNFDSLKAISFMSTLEVGGFIGSVIIGFLSDFIAKKPEELRSSYHNPKLSLAGLCTVFYSIGLYLICNSTIFHKDIPYPIFLTITFLLGACVFGPIQLYGVIATESAPPHLSGTSHAIVAACANFGAIISGYPVLKLASIYSLKYVFFLLFSISFMCVGLMIICRLIATVGSSNKTKITGSKKTR